MKSSLWAWLKRVGSRGLLWLGLANLALFPLFILYASNIEEQSTPNAPIHSAFEIEEIVETIDVADLEEDGVAGEPSPDNGWPTDTSDALSPPVKPTQVAYVTLCTDEKYLDLVLVLAYSLRRSQAQFPLIVLVTSALEEDGRRKLEALGCQVLEVDIVPKPPAPLGRGARTFREDRERVFTKLNIWLMTDFDTLLFLDADILVLKNMDHLFDRDLAEHAIAAVYYCGFYCECSKTFNSGVMLVKPSVATFNLMVEGFHALKWGGQGDQAYLNAFFKIKGTIVSLPHAYNVGKNVARCKFDELWLPETFYAFHFAGNDVTHPNRSDPRLLDETVGSEPTKASLLLLEPKARERQALLYYQKLWRQWLAAVDLELA